MNLLVAVLCLVGGSLACTPVNVHYQTSYCKAKVAVMVRIENETTESRQTRSENETSSEASDSKSEYEGTILSVLKGNTWPLGSTVVVSLPEPANSCESTELIVGEKYVILGKSRSSKKITVKPVNGVRNVTSDEDETNLKRRIESYDCRCRITNANRPSGLPRGPGERGHGRGREGWPGRGRGEGRGRGRGEGRGRGRGRGNGGRSLVCRAPSTSGCEWEEGACVLRGRSCRYISNCPTTEVTE